MHAPPPLPLDLHVLSLPLAFILSQDQTLRCVLSFLFSQNNIRGARPASGFIFRNLDGIIFLSLFLMLFLGLSVA